MILKFKKKSALILSLLILTLIIACDKYNAANDNTLTKQPNIILVYADDLGFTDVGVYHDLLRKKGYLNYDNYYETPHLDSLAKTGVIFTSAYSNAPNCAPSRAALLSGQYGVKNKVRNTGHPENGIDSLRSLIPPPNSTKLSLEITTIGNAMTYAGYNSVHFGKWHNGYGKNHIPVSRGFRAKWTQGIYKGLFMSETLYRPTRWAHFHHVQTNAEGFENFFDGAMHMIFGDFDDPRNSHKEEHKVYADSLIEKSTYLSDYMDTRLGQMVKDLSQQNRPFFINYNPFLVHNPLSAPEKDVGYFKNKTGNGSDSNPIYAAMLKKLDENVGNLLKILRQNGIADNTIIIFTSDNGGVGGYREMGFLGTHNTSNMPLRGGKGMLYEGGIRVPFIIAGKGIKKIDEPIDEPISGIDIFPTLLELVGISEKQDWQLDGKSIVPLLNKKRFDREYIAFHFPAYQKNNRIIDGDTLASWRMVPGSAIRSKDYKLIEYFTGESKPGDGSNLELYNLQNDLGEQVNLIDSLPEIKQKLYSQLHQWRTENKADYPFNKSNITKVYDFQGLTLTTLSTELKTHFSFPGGGVLILHRNNRIDINKRLRSSSIITHVDGVSVQNIEELQKVLKDKKKVKIVLWYGYKEYEVDLKVTEILQKSILRATYFQDDINFKITEQL